MSRTEKPSRMKKNFLFSSLLVSALGFVLFLGSCDTTSYDIPKYTEFVMQIDSIQMPSTIKLGQRLDIKFYGTIGPDGCYRFSRFAAKADNKTISVTVYGRHEEKDLCNEAVSYLNGGLLQINMLDTGRYVVHVSQPKPPDIFDTVYVTTP